MAENVLKRLLGRIDEKSDINIKQLRQEVDGCFNSTKSTREEMTRYLKRYKGEWWNLDGEGKLRNSDSTVALNLVHSTVSTIAPLLTDNKPQWSVRARVPYMQRYIEALSLKLDYDWDVLDMDDVVLRWVMDALIMKIGIVKCLYDEEEQEDIVENVDPRTFFIARGFDRLWKAPMCGTRTRRSLAYIRMNWAEKGKDVKADALDDEWHMMVNDTGEKEAYEDSDAQSATLYEVWLKDDEMEDYYVNEKGDEVEKKEEKAEKKSRKKYPYGRFVIFTEGVLLEDKPSVYTHGKPPYVELYDYLVPHEFFGMGEVDQIEEMNKAVNRSMQLMDQWQRYYCDPPWLLDSNAGLEVETVKTELRSGGGIFTYNALSNSSRPPLEKAPTQPLDQTVYNYLNFLMKAIEESSGQADITKGRTSKSQRQSATEISTLIESAYTRTRQRVRNLENSIGRLQWLRLHNMQQFYIDTKHFSLVEDGEISYYTVSNNAGWVREALQPTEQEMGQENSQVVQDYNAFLTKYGGLQEVDPVYAAFDLEIQTNSTLPMDKQSLANLLLRLLEMANANPATGIPIWEAVLNQLKIPKYKNIIQEIKKRADAENQQPQQGGQQQAGAGLPGMLEVVGGQNNVRPDA